MIWRLRPFAFRHSYPLISVGFHFFRGFKFNLCLWNFQIGFDIVRTGR